MFKYLRSNIFINLLTILLIFILDRAAKMYVLNGNFDGLKNQFVITNYLNLELVWNQGVAFGLLSMDDNNLYNLLTLLITTIIIIILFISFKSKGSKKIAFLMIAGGALGNLYDRIIYKKVPDFIDFHIGEFHWFIFNIADIFITLGVIFMIIIEFIEPNKK